MLHSTTEITFASSPAQVQLSPALQSVHPDNDALELDNNFAVHYPSLELQRTFLRAYLSEFHNGTRRAAEADGACPAVPLEFNECIDDSVSDELLTTTVLEANRFAMVRRMDCRNYHGHRLRGGTDLSMQASHLLWGLWGLVQSKHSHIEYDFFKYAQDRLRAYYECKRDNGFTMLSRDQQAQLAL